MDDVGEDKDLKTSALTPPPTPRQTQNTQLKHKIYSNIKYSIYIRMSFRSLMSTRRVICYQVKNLDMNFQKMMVS